MIIERESKPTCVVDEKNSPTEVKEIKKSSLFNLHANGGIAKLQMTTRTGS